jgi:hypothetical protein
MPNPVVQRATSSWWLLGDAPQGRLLRATGKVAPGSILSWGADAPFAIA